VDRFSSRKSFWQTELRAASGNLCQYCHVSVILSHNDSKSAEDVNHRLIYYYFFNKNEY